MTNILVTGANGQLGSELKEQGKNYAYGKIYFTDVDTLNITKLSEIESFVKSYDIHFIVNCAAYTAVDKAEDEPELAELLNAKAVYNLAQIAFKYELKLIHVSTDYVFDGNNYLPYTELDATNPTSIYGNTKLKGEQVILNSNIAYIILRTSWLYSSHGNNFVKTMLKLGKDKNELNIVFDQIGTPTYAKNLAQAILHIIKNYITDSIFEIGIYHYSNQGVCSWYDFAHEIFKIKRIKCMVNPVTSDKFPTKAIRPKYSVLNKQKITETYALTIPHWTDALHDCLSLIK